MNSGERFCDSSHADQMHITESDYRPLFVPWRCCMDPTRLGHEYESLAALHKQTSKDKEGGQ